MISYERPNKGILRAARAASLAILCLLYALLPTASARTITVDTNATGDYPTIQAAIDAATDGDTVILRPGTYTGNGNRDVDFKGKAITIRSENGAQTCIIDCQGTNDDPHRGFSFHSGEDADSIIQGLTITHGLVIRHEPGGGILCQNSSPKITDCIIVGNEARTGGGVSTISSSTQIIDCIVKDNVAADGGGLEIGTNDNGAVLIKGCIITGNHAVIYPMFGGAGGGMFIHSFTDIHNCTITANRAGWRGGGIHFSYGANVSNSVIWGNTFQFGSGSEIAFNTTWGTSNPDVIIESSLIGSGNEDDIFVRTECLYGQWIRGDPFFAEEGYWDPNGTSDDLFDDFWVDGDYHLKSQAGRWDPDSGSWPCTDSGAGWVKDDVTSPCIDAGDPHSPIGYEPFPNGGIINMGAYGGTAEASKSHFGKPVCETILAGDINGDCNIDIADFALMATHWLEDNSP